MTHLEISQRNINVTKVVAPTWYQQTQVIWITVVWPIGEKKNEGHNDWLCVIESATTKIRDRGATSAPSVDLFINITKRLNICACTCHIFLNTVRVLPIDVVSLEVKRGILHKTAISCSNVGVC